MTGPEHYNKAEQLAEKSYGQDCEQAAYTVQLAQVHATLALAAPHPPTQSAEATDAEPQSGDLWADKDGDRYFVADGPYGGVLAVCWGDATSTLTWAEVKKCAPLYLISRDDTEVNK